MRVLTHPKDTGKVLGRIALVFVLLEMNATFFLDQCSFVDELFAEMELTNEQYDIINSTGNIKINAVAGLGKTTTILEYAKAIED